MYDLSITILFMDLNTIEIPDLILSELYRDNLLATEIKTGVTTTRQPSAPLITSAKTTMPPKESISSKEPASSLEFTRTKEPAPSDIPPHAKESSVPGTVPARNAVTPSATTPIPAYKYLGKNQRQITIIIQSPGIAFLPDDQLTVLTKMLEACRMNIGDVAIINHANTPVAITTLREQLHPSIILLFGIQPVDIRLPINFPIFKIQAYDDCTYLYAPPLSELVPPTEESKLLKSKLWVCLKTLFAV
jgi:hypothetical protein